MSEHIDLLDILHFSAGSLPSASRQPVTISFYLLCSQQEDAERVSILLDLLLADGRITFSAL